MKKGISPVISAVLLIAFVIILFLFVSAWVRSSIVEETTSGTGGKLSSSFDCMNTKLEVSDVEVRTDGRRIIMNVDNMGETTVDGLKIRIIDEGGVVGLAEETGTDTPSLGRVLNIGRERPVDPAVDDENLVRVEVHPILSGGEVCENSAKVNARYIKTYAP